MKRVRTAATAELTHAGFKEIKSPGKNSLFYSKQQADYQDSMKILDEAGLRAPTHQEALSFAPELIEALMGKWFYLAGKSLEESGFYTFNEHGNLLPLIGKENRDQKVLVFPGNGQLVLGIYRLGLDNARFGLFPDFTPFSGDQVLVGLKKEAMLKPPKGIPKRGSSS